MKSAILILPVWLVLGRGAILSAPGVPAAEQTRRAKQLVLAGQPEQAVPIYRALVAADPHNTTLRLDLVVAEFKARRYAEVIRECRTILQSRPSTTAAWLFLGAARFQLGHYAEAVEPFRKVLARRPRERNARLMLAWSLLQLKRYAEAGREFLNVSRQLPRAPRVWYGMERSYRILSRRATRELKKKAPESAWWFALLGADLMKQQQYGTALHYFRRALALQPGLRGVHAQLAALYQRTSHPDWAAQEEAREKALPAPDCGRQRLACDFLAGHYDRVAAPPAPGDPPAVLYWKARAADRLATRAFDRLMELPDSPLRHELLARAGDSRADYREAIRQWRLALQMDPGNPVLEQGLATSLYNVRDFAAALRVLKKLLRRRPGSPELNFLCGGSYLNRKQPARAVPYLERAVRADPAFLPARAALGQAYLESGQPAKAIPHIRAALGIDTDGMAHFRLARAYRMTGRPELARRALRRFQQLRAAGRARRHEREAPYKVTAP